MIKKIISNLSILFISITISLFVAEFLLKKLDESKNNTNDSKIILNDYSELIKLKKEKGALSIIPGTIYLKRNDMSVLPLSGISNKETIFGNENNYLVTYKSDRFGFRNFDEIWSKDNLNTIIIGDSYAHGAQVLDDDTISGILNKKEKVTLNLGYGGTGPLSQYAILKEYIKEVKTKNILWIYYEGNDIHDLRSELNNKVLKNYLNNNNFIQNLKDRQLEMDNIHFESLSNLRKVTKNNFKNKIIDFFSFPLIKNFLFISYSSIKPIPDEFERIVSLMKNLSSNNNAKLYFVYLPEYFRFSGYKNYFKYKRDYKIILSLISKYNIPIIDFADLIEKNFESPLELYPFKKFGHFNSSGYRFIAEKIEKKIE